LRRELGQLTATETPLLGQIREDPSRILTLAGKYPDDWQTTLLRRSSDRVLILAGRQIGKSLVAAALALKTALLEAPALTLILSPSLRQSAETYRKVADLNNALGRPVPTVSPRDNTLRLELANGSRIISLPGTESTIRGYSGVRLLVVDEAARVDDALYFSIRPMLAVSGGKLVCLSSAWGRRGFFYEAWQGGGPEWQRTKVLAAECGRIRPEFLAEERRVLGERIYAREYECVFSATDDAVFAFDSVMAAMTPGGEPPLF
jgi:hypothetical protein